MIASICPGRSNQHPFAVSLNTLELAQSLFSEQPSFAVFCRERTVRIGVPPQQALEELHSRYMQDTVHAIIAGVHVNQGTLRKST